MTLADTSIWIDHFRADNASLRELIETESLGSHPFVIGEIACGSLKNRAAVLGYLAQLPRALPASNEEVMALLERRALWNKGIGWVDAHLLASALLSRCRLWTLDVPLLTIARSLDISYA
jgi:predicted nucleic acid-binding protein